MTKFYSMCSKNSKKSAVAHAARDLDDLSLWELIDGINSPEEWPDLRFELGDGQITDLPPTDILGRLCSPKLVSVVSSFDADIMWLPVKLHKAANELGYYFMHFRSVPDTLNKEKTVYVAGSVFTPHLSLTKASQFPLFILHPRDSLTFVRQDVKNAIESAGCVGVEFEKVAAS